MTFLNVLPIVDECSLLHVDSIGMCELDGIHSTTGQILKNTSYITVFICLNIPYNHSRSKIIH